MTTRSIRILVATALTIFLVLAVWKFIDWRMQPPPPKHRVAPAKP